MSVSVSEPKRGRHNEVSEASFSKRGVSGNLGDGRGDVFAGLGVDACLEA